MNLNKTILAGRLTRDVELRYLSSGTAVSDLGLAINERVKRGDEWVDEPVFVDVTVFGKTAENCNQYLRKGSSILVEGWLRLDQWETPQGEKRQKLKVVAQQVQFGARPDNEKRQEQAPATRQAVPVNSKVDRDGYYEDDNVPF